MPEGRPTARFENGKRRSFFFFPLVWAKEDTTTVFRFMFLSMFSWKEGKKKRRVMKIPLSHALIFSLLCICDLRSRMAFPFTLSSVDAGSTPLSDSVLILAVASIFLLVMLGLLSERAVTLVFSYRLLIVRYRYRCGCG